MVLVVCGYCRGCSECPVGQFAGVAACIPWTDFQREVSVLEGTAVFTCSVLTPSPEACKSCPAALSEVFLPCRIVTHLPDMYYVFCLLLWVLGTQQ